jgi:neutral trehalase
MLRKNPWPRAPRDISRYNLDDTARGTRAGAILESGLDNSPMYDDATYNPGTHTLEFADVGLMSMYIADCDALATIADDLGKAAAASEIRERATRYRARLATLWDNDAGIFLNKDLHTGQFSSRLSPTNFYPPLGRVDHSLHRAGRSRVQGSELLARANLGAHELPGVPWAAQL